MQYCCIYNIEQCSIQQYREPALIYGSTMHIAILIGSDRAMNVALLLEVIRTMFVVVFFLLCRLACYKLSKMKTKNIGALGNTWRHKFCMGTQNDINLER